jgi:hypothetical protein
VTLSGSPHAGRLDLRSAVQVAVLVAVRRPGWGVALGVDAAVVVGALSALRWGPPGAAVNALTLAAVLLAAATASLLDDDMAGLTATVPTPLRVRTLARLALGSVAAAGAWAATVRGAERVAPDVWPDGVTPLAVTLVGAGAALGAITARRLGDLPAALPTALVLTPVAFLLDDVPWPTPLPELARWAALDPGERTAWSLVAAALAVLLATRDPAARTATRLRR